MTYGELREGHIVNGNTVASVKRQGTMVTVRYVDGTPVRTTADTQVRGTVRIPSEGAPPMASIDQTQPAPTLLPSQGGNPADFVGAPLSVENPAVRRTAAEMGIQVWTDQLGKDTADTSTGIVVESRYFIGNVLIERAIVPNGVGNPTFQWTVRGEHFTTAVAALRHADLLHRTGL